MTHPEQQVEDRARQFRIDTERDCGCRIPYPYNEVAEFAIQAAHAAGIAEGREAMREECARRISKVQAVFKANSKGDDLHAGAQFGAKCAGEAVCSLPTVAGEG